MINPTVRPFVTPTFRVIGLFMALGSTLAYAWFVAQGISESSGLGIQGLVDLMVFRPQPEAAGRWIRSFFLVGILLVILAPEDREDEWIQQTRMDAITTTSAISLVSILGYTIVGPVATERLISVNVWLNLTALTYLAIFRMRLRSELLEPLE